MEAFPLTCLEFLFGTKPKSCKLQYYTCWNEGRTERFLPTIHKNDQMTGGLEKVEN